MIRLFPKFWKLNSNSHHWTIVLSMAVALRYSVVGSLPWVWHLHLEYSYQAKYLVFLIMLHPEQLSRKIQNVYNTDEAAQRFGWIRTRNHEIWVLNPILLFIFFGPITACASDHPHIYVHHCETDYVHGMMSFVPLFGAENQSFGTSTTHHGNSSVTLGFIFVVIF